MKRIAIGVLAVAISAAAGGAFAQNYGQNNSDYQNYYGSNYNYGDRGDRSDTNAMDRAQVIRIERVGHDHGPETYQRQECWNERTRNYDSGYYRDDHDRLYRGDSSNNKVAGTLLGALVGGALGNQVGKGDGKKAATIAGAVIGGTVGNNVADHDHDDYGDQNDNYRYSDYRDNSGVVRRCRTVIAANENFDGHSTGYRVTYRYAGHTYQSVINRNPGQWMPVRVNVRPAEGYRR
ncbi:MAG: glycine zipper 2TM domain-containing protein [Lysobacteraceae bacterium]